MTGETKRSRLLHVCLGLVVLGGLAGCGGGTGTVSGKVSYQGKPLKGGTVSFIFEQGKKARSSPISEDGSYQIADVPLGTVQVTVETDSVKPAALSVPKGTNLAALKKVMPGKFAPDEKRTKYVEIPEKYRSPDKSGLVCTVKRGHQAHDIDLK